MSIREIERYIHTYVRLAGRDMYTIMSVAKVCALISSLTIIQ